MTNEPSKEAKQRACDLANEVAPDHVGNGWQPNHCEGDRWPAMAALARHIQQTSDVAKAADKLLGNMCMTTLVEAAAIRKALQSLILDDEPKTFTVKMLMTREEQLRAIGRALDEGKTIKIVQADD